MQTKRALVLLFFLVAAGAFGAARTGAWLRELWQAGAGGAPPTPAGGGPAP